MEEIVKNILILIVTIILGYISVKLDILNFVMLSLIVRLWINEKYE